MARAAARGPSGRNARRRFACLQFVLDEVDGVDLTGVLESIADMDFPSAKTISDAWVANVALAVRMVRERLQRDWSLAAARRLALERHAWATWISLDPVNPNWLAVFLDSADDGFWANPSDHDAYWCLIFARHADNAALANSIQRAGARPALPALLESEAERRREVAQAFATGSMRRLMPPSGVAREVFDNADLVHMITRRVVE